MGPQRTERILTFIPTRRHVTGSKHLCLDDVILCVPYYLSFMWYTVPTDSCYQKVITIRLSPKFFGILFWDVGWLLTFLCPYFIIHPTNMQEKF